MNAAPIGPPRTAAEWALYYALRYAVLRQPWGQPAGSERLPDDDAPTTAHALALSADGSQALGVARLHPAEAPRVAQVRAVAVAPAAQGRGLGQQLMHYLEEHAQAIGRAEIELHARENAVPFYRRLGYAVEAPSYLLFGVIPHFLMRKVL